MTRLWVILVFIPIILCTQASAQTYSSPYDGFLNPNKPADQRFFVSNSDPNKFFYRQGSTNTQGVSSLNLCVVKADKSADCKPTPSSISFNVSISSQYTDNISIDNIRVALVESSGNYSSTLWHIADTLYISSVNPTSLTGSFNKIDTIEIPNGEKIIDSYVIRLDHGSFIFFVTEQKQLFFIPPLTDKHHYYDGSMLSKIVFPKNQKVGKFYPFMGACSYGSGVGLVLTDTGNVYHVMPNGKSSNPMYECLKSEKLVAKPVLLNKKIKLIGGWVDNSDDNPSTTSYLDQDIFFALGDAGGVYHLRSSTLGSSASKNKPIVWADFRGGHFIDKDGDVYIFNNSNDYPNSPDWGFVVQDFPEKIVHLQRSGYGYFESHRPGYDSSVIGAEISFDFHTTIDLALSEKNNLYLLYRIKKIPINGNLSVAALLDENFLLGTDLKIYRYDYDIDHNHDHSDFTVTFTTSIVSKDLSTYCKDLKKDYQYNIPLIKVCSETY